MIVLKKKQVLILGMATIFAIAGYLNFTYGDADRDSPETLGEVRLVSGDNVETDVLGEARLSREIGRDQSAASLESIIRDTSTSAEGRTKAEEALIQLSRLAETEAQTESLICAQGFKDAVLYIKEDSATAIIKTEGLSEAQAASIADIITTQTGLSHPNIKIIEAK